VTYAVADRVSEWLEKAMIMVERRRKDLFGIRLVVQVEKDKVDQFIQTAKRAGIKYIGAVNNMVLVDVKELADIDKLAKIPGVMYISYEKKFYPMALGIDELVKRIIVATDPIFSKLSFGDLTKLGFRFRPPNKLPTPFQALVQNINLLIKAWSNPLNLTEQIRWNFPFGLPVIARAPFMIVTQTRSLMDAPEDYEIKNTLVGVIDTGTRYGPAIGSPMNVKVIPLTLLPEPPMDLMGHGCLRNVKVYTSFCGIVDVEELWDLVDTEPLPMGDGEFKPFNAFTVDMDGIARAKGIYRVKSEKKVVIKTPLGTIEATPWHRFLVANPRKSKRKGDSHRRWDAGFDIVEKRADQLSQRDINNKGDWLVFKTYNGEAWSLGLDPELAYLGGLIRGDGTIIYQNVNIKTGHVYTRKRGTRNEIVIADDSEEFLKELKGTYGGKVFADKRQNSYKLRICGKSFIDKMVPYIQPPINDLEAFRAWVAGFFDAEGYVDLRDDRPSSRVRICNTDLSLLTTLRDVLNALGIPCTITSGGTSKGSRTYHLTILVPQLFYRFVESYCIKKREELAKASRADSKVGRVVKYISGYVLVPIKRVEIVKSGEYFYDLADTDRGYYSASGFVVHNSWITSCAFGRQAMTRYGKFVPVAQAPMVYHVKVFNAFGSTTEFQVMKAMEYLAKKGAKVVNMSLGASLTDPVDKDPTSKLLSELTKEYGTIFVVAGGNEGPDSWTIASPGASPDAITVGAMDWATMNVPSYSSRGPQGMYYKDSQDVFEDHLQRYGDNFLKPDVVGIGGDEESQIVAGCSPWYDGMYDYLPDGFDEMIGSSMATPHVAGLIALLYDRGIIKTTEDVKRVLAKFSSTKSKELGYGLFKYSMFMYPTGGEAVGGQGGGVY